MAPGLIFSTVDGKVNEIAVEVILPVTQIQVTMSIFDAGHLIGSDRVREFFSSANPHAIRQTEFAAIPSANVGLEKPGGDEITPVIAAMRCLHIELVHRIER